MSKKCLPEWLKNAKHDDYIWPLCYIPRSWNAFCSGMFSKVPKLLFGNGRRSRWQGKIYPLAVPAPGQWVLCWPLYFAFTTKKGFHVRIGARYDKYDLYYTCPSVAAKFPDCLEINKWRFPDRFKQ